MQWQPIDTAPVEESVLVYNGPDGSVGIACQDSGGAWRSDEGTPIVYALTHWMPIPDPPE